MARSNIIWFTSEEINLELRLAKRVITLRNQSTRQEVLVDQTVAYQCGWKKRGWIFAEVGWSGCDLEWMDMRTHRVFMYEGHMRLDGVF